MKPAIMLRESCTENIKKRKNMEWMKRFGKLLVKGVTINIIFHSLAY